MNWIRNAAWIAGLALLGTGTLAARAAPPAPALSAAEQDATDTVHYMLTLLNGQAMFRAAVSRTTLSARGRPVVEGALRRMDMRVLSQANAPMVAAAVDADTLRTCARFVQAPEQTALLGIVPDSDSPQAALAAMPPAQRQQVLDVLQTPCLMAVGEALNEPGAQVVLITYANQLLCDAWDALPPEQQYDRGQAGLTCPAPAPAPGPGTATPAAEAR